MVNKEIEDQQTKKSFARTFRVFQALFFGIFALGLSMIAGDLTGAIRIPISTFSMTTTIFGLLGAIITGSMAKRSQEW